MINETDIINNYNSGITLIGLSKLYKVSTIWIKHKGEKGEYRNPKNKLI